MEPRTPQNLTRVPVAGADFFGALFAGIVGCGTTLAGSLLDSNQKGEGLNQSGIRLLCAQFTCRQIHRPTESYALTGCRTASFSNATRDRAALVCQAESASSIEPFVGQSGTWMPRRIGACGRMHFFSRAAARMGIIGSSSPTCRCIANTFNWVCRRTGFQNISMKKNACD